ncbi:diphthine methyltransferase-like [Physella acuta]|uniref:diphthine methyltransferase-like n=1 Tax=Physella acuta TaxID=109671 RepID=UPI0027DBBF42|nr:diphthine methyltransferase-like [Physella acuta]
MDVENTRTITTVDTVLNADSVEWCPHLGMEDVLLCGTYKLEESIPNNKTEESSSQTEANEQNEEAAKQIRHGGVIVYKLLPNEDLGLIDLQENQTLKMCGVLDIKWLEHQIEDEAIFGLVDAEGNLQLLKLNKERIAEFVTKSQLSESSLGLSLGWTYKNSSPCVAASDSSGSVTVFDASKNLSVVSQWKAHDYEAWITAFNRYNPNIVYSGGDDCKFKMWDLRDISQPTLCSTRHKMGVCSVQDHPFNEHITATGSYDEELIIWDHRHMKQPICSVTLNGGIWRIKWDPFKGDKILTATMYNGAHIVDCTDLGKGTLPIAAHYNHHNLAYGADWYRMNWNRDLRGEKSSKTSSNSMLISTCSFYDQSLHLWEWKYQ